MNIKEVNDFLHNLTVNDTIEITTGDQSTLPYKWMEMEEIKNSAAAVICSVGFYLYHDEDYVKIAGMRGDDGEYKYVHVIPKHNILGMRKLL